MKLYVLFALAAALVGTQAQAGVRTGRLTDLQECSISSGKCRSIAKPAQRACSILVGNHQMVGYIGNKFPARYSIEALGANPVRMTGVVVVYNPEGTLNGVIHQGGEGTGEWIGHRSGAQAVVDVFYIRKAIIGAGKYLEYKCKLK